MRTLLALILLVGSAQAAERTDHPRLRKGLAVAACAASAFDLGTTAVAAHNPNLREANGLFASPGGHPRMITLALAKAGACGVGLYFAWKPRTSGNLPMYGSAATTAILTTVGFHNLSVLERAK